MLVEKSVAPVPVLAADASLEEVREHFSHDRFVSGALGAQILEAGAGHAACAFDLEECHLNEKGGVNGKQIDMDVQDEKGDVTGERAHDADLDGVGARRAGTATAAHKTEPSGDEAGKLDELATRNVVGHCNLLPEAESRPWGVTVTLATDAPKESAGKEGFNPPQHFITVPQQSKAATTPYLPLAGSCPMEEPR